MTYEAAIKVLNCIEAAPGLSDRARLTAIEALEKLIRIEESLEAAKARCVHHDYRAWLFMKELETILNERSQNMTYFYEDKEVVTNALFQALKTTVEGVNIAEMEYKRLQDNTELVTLIYDNGYRKTVNVSCDSGVALMKDVLRAIVL